MVITVATRESTRMSGIFQSRTDEWRWHACGLSPLTWHTLRWV